MRVLALDSSGLVASVAVVEGKEGNADACTIAEYTVNYKKTHSQTLLPMLDEVAKMTDLDLASIDAVAVAAGPGSFTGLRIGSATAKGLGLALGQPVFVLEIRPETNEIVVGSHEESLTRQVRARGLNFMSLPDLPEKMRVWAKIRYNHKGAWCVAEKTGEDEILCTFEEPQRAVTPGQALVLYDGDYVLGGGTIVKEE